MSSTKIESIDQLVSIYDATIPAAIDKVRSFISPKYHEWIEQCSFVVLATVGPQGTDASPRGDVGPVVTIVDEQTLWLPDWRGNNRLDSLRNIVEDGRMSLMFMVNGSNNVVRINGTAHLTIDDAITSTFEKEGKRPRSVIVVSVQEVYYQCAKALMRSRLWQGAGESTVPTAGEFIKELKADFDSETYDAGYAEYAKERMW